MGSLASEHKCAVKRDLAHGDFGFFIALLIISGPLIGSFVQGRHCPDCWRDGDLWLGRGMFVATTQQLFGAEDLHVVVQNFGLLLIGASLAFLLEISEYLLVSFTSGLTLCVAGIFKEICTLVLAAEINGDRMSPLNFIGLVVCLLGIGLHVLLKAVHTKGKEKQDADTEMEMNGMGLLEESAGQN